MAQSVKNLHASTAGMDSIPRSGKFLGEGNGYPLQCSCLGNITFFWLVGGEVTRWCSRNLIICLLPTSLESIGLCSALSYCLPPEWDSRFCRRTQRYVLDYSAQPLGRNQDLALLFLDCFSLFLHSLTSLFINCLNLPFRTQGRSRRQKLFSYKQEMGTQ